MRPRSLLLVLALLASGRLAAAESPAFPTVTAIAAGHVVVADQGRTLTLKPGEATGIWAFMGVTTASTGELRAIFEDFSTIQGRLAVADVHGAWQDFSKSAEPTWAESATLYRGHPFADVTGSDHDLLGAEILARPEDPAYEDVARCLAPLTKLETYAFVGTRECPDKVGVAYGGRTANFDPAVYGPAIAAIRSAGRVLDGLVGGWLPVLRFVYPEKEGDWTEYVLFAPGRVDNGNPRIQPVWYRVCRIEGHALKWVKYFDSNPPFPPRDQPPPGDGFYRDLLALRQDWDRTLAPGVQLELPDARLANQARHSLARAMITRNGSFPKYGVLDRNYGGAEHDGFQDTLNVDVTTMLAWGLFGPARDYLDNYFTYFVRDDGSILYRGPETGQYGRMLTVVADYLNLTGDGELLLKHRARIDAVTRLLLGLRRRAQTLPAADPAHGMIVGWCEADSCLLPDPARYQQPYLSNSSEAARGFGDLGAAWEHLGNGLHRADLTAWGAELRGEARSLAADLHAAIRATMLTTTTPACLPVIAGATEPFDVAARRDTDDPQFRAYRASMELLFSGCLTRSEAETVVRYREAHRDILVGVPAAYGYDSREMAGFLSYGHAYGLLQHDFVREYLLELYSLSAHQYTRGTWTAPETRRINPADAAAPYCVPAQLAVPLLVRWALAWEDPNADELWLARATPRAWLRDGLTVAATKVPTRWGQVGIRLQSHLDARRIDATVDLPAAGAPSVTHLRLRVPEGRTMVSVELNGKAWTEFDAKTETIRLPAAAGGKFVLVVKYH